jgi:hypothetical protein
MMWRPTLAALPGNRLTDVVIVFDKPHLLLSSPQQIEYVVALVSGRIVP